MAHWYAQTYKFDQYVDLRDLCKRIAEKIPRLHDHSMAVANALDPTNDVRLEPAKRSAILKSGCSGFAYQYSYGLSIYFPWAFMSPEYQKMQFASETVGRVSQDAPQEDATRGSIRQGRSSRRPARSSRRRSRSRHPRSNQPGSKSSWR